MKYAFPFSDLEEIEDFSTSDLKEIEDGNFTFGGFTEAIYIFTLPLLIPFVGIPVMLLDFIIPIVHVIYALNAIDIAEKATYLNGWLP